MAIDYVKVNYGLMKAGDTLVVTGKPHYDGGGRVAVETGAEVLVEEVHPAGVTVKTKEGDLVSFYFEHGSDKLKYTAATKDAIKKRDEFATKKAAGQKAEDKKAEATA